MIIPTIINSFDTKIPCYNRRHKFELQLKVLPSEKVPNILGKTTCKLLLDSFYKLLNY